MVPIHDTDLAEERWSKAEWENYELWEKIELRLRRQKRLWILATFVLFIVLSSVPILIDRWPKWKTRSIARQLAQEVNRVKQEAIAARAAYRLRFVGDGKLDFVVERLASCTATEGEKIRTVSLVDGSKRDSFAWVNSSKGLELQIPGLVNEFCYDSLIGSVAPVQEKDMIAFGIMPVNDLTEKRIDRLSLLMLSGASAEISFD